jgi:hypothetical protein
LVLELDPLPGVVFGEVGELQPVCLRGSVDPACSGARGVVGAA